MSEKNNPLSGQPADETLSAKNGSMAESPEDILAQVDVDGMGFPTDFLQNMLSDLENDAHADAVEAAPQEHAAQNEPLPDAPAVQQENSERSETADEPSEEPEEVSDADEGEADTAEASPLSDETAPEPDEEPVDESPVQEPDVPEIPSVAETSLTVPDQNDATASMTLIERAQYHARMRRREQTRLRRENARREAAGVETAYQPMSPMDMRFTLIRLAVAAVFLVVGLLFQQMGISFAFHLIAYLITMLPVAVKVAHNFTHDKYFDEYLLILISSLGAILLGHRAEASLILILHGVGKMASDLVLSSTHKSLSQQTAFVPDKACLVNMQGDERQVSPDEIRVGNFVLVRSG